MAIVTLRVPDETLEKYKQMHPSNPSLAMENQLKKYQEVSYKERNVILPGEARRELEAIYGTSIESPSAFVGWVKRLVTISVEGLEFSLKAGQRKTIEGEASFWKKDFKPFAQVRIQNMIDSALGRG